MGKEIRLRSFTITQDLDRDHWVGYDDVFDEESSNMLESLTQEVFDRLHVDEQVVGDRVDGEIEPVMIASIIHDKDTQEVFDVDTSSYVVKDKHKHVHMFVELNRTVTLSILAELLGLERNYIESLARGRYAKENTLAYLVHAKNADKYLYDPRDVETLGTFDYVEYYGEHHRQWQGVRSTKKKKEVDLPQVDWMIEQVISGQLTREQIMLTDEYFTVYATNKRKIDEAFELYADRKAYKATEMMQRGEFILNCFYITGKPGSGKTHFTKSLIKELQKMHPGWSVYQGASTNPFDDYKGEEIIFLDDLRPSSMTSSDWLKLLDPINASPISARYHNRLTVPRLILMTAYMPIDQFFYFVRDKGSDRSEALDQFIRRFAGLVRVIRYKDESLFSYSPINKLESPKEIKVLENNKGALEFSYDGKKALYSVKDNLNLGYYPEHQEKTSNLSFEKNIRYFAEHITKLVMPAKDVTPE